MSNTPRTDAAIAASDGQWSFVLRDLAQELEREVASLKATIADPDEVELAMIRGEIAIPHRVGFDYIIGNP
jgi:hypothetical protein